MCVSIAVLSECVVHVYNHTPPINTTWFVILQFPLLHGISDLWSINSAALHLHHSLPWVRHPPLLRRTQTPMLARRARTRSATKLSLLHPLSSREKFGSLSSQELAQHRPSKPVSRSVSSITLCWCMIWIIPNVNNVTSKDRGIYRGVWKLQPPLQCISKDSSFWEPFVKTAIDWAPLFQKWGVSVNQICSSVEATSHPASQAHGKHKWNSFLGIQAKGALLYPAGQPHIFVQTTKQAKTSFCEPDPALYKQPNSPRCYIEPNQLSLITQLHKIPLYQITTEDWNKYFTRLQATAFVHSYDYL
jgi:hypothetical protein